MAEPSGQPPLPARLRGGGWDRWLPLLAVVAAVASVATFLAVRGGDRRADAPAPVSAATTEPTPGRTPAATASPTTEAPSEPTEPPGDPLDLSDIAEQVAALRGTRAGRSLDARLVDAATLADKVSQVGFSDLDAEETENDQRLLVALRLAPPRFDLAAVLESLYREQILGLYVPEEKTLYVRGNDASLSPGVRFTAAHEIVHAFQDRRHDLVAMQKSVEEDPEASGALLALIEGDAVVTQQQWVLRHLDAAQREQAYAEGATGGDALARAPRYLRNSLFFPYTAGTAFVTALYRRGGQRAVDRAFEDPPTTTEHILHPERYLEGEPAADVSVVTEPGDDWEESVTYPFGEFDVAELFSSLGDDTATALADGWGGGEVSSWERGRETAVALRLAFDTAADARAVCDAVPRWYTEVADARQARADTLRGDRDEILALECAGERVDVGIAPDVGTARRLVGGG